MLPQENDGIDAGAHHAQGPTLDRRSCTTLWKENAMAIPYRGSRFTLHQPDGTPLQVRAWGNQYNAVFETLDGFTVTRNPATGAYEYAKPSEDGERLLATGGLAEVANPVVMGLTRGMRPSRAGLRALARENSTLPRGTSRWEERRREQRETELAAAAGIVKAPPRRKTVGKFVGLCLLIEFDDQKGTIAPQEVSDFCNKPGYAGFGNKGSVRDYFLEISNGNLDYTNVVTPYYRAKHPRKYYTDESIPQPERARELIKEALAHWKAQKFDFSALTADSQGYAYATNVFYAGRRVNNWSKGLWPHAFHLMTPVALTPGASAFDYQITDMTEELSLGTFCHENGHMVCDFPDLYDYGDESAGVGAFCLMCGGANADEKNPTHVGAYLKYRAGWASSLVNMTDGLKATAQAAKNQFFLHRKGPTEYFILENRWRHGRDAALPSEGLAIWHVDELGDNANEQMTTAKHYECALLQADGRNDLEHDVANQGDAGDLYVAPKDLGPTTQPASRWWDGSQSNLGILSVSGPGQSMAFKVRL
jgi:M6 family metalloprotease-like protein